MRAAHVTTTSGAAGVSAINSTKCAEPEPSQFRCARFTQHLSRGTRRTSRGVTGIEIVRRLLLALRRHLCGRELGRAARAAETRLRDVVLAGPRTVALAFRLLRHGGPRGSPWSERLGRAGRSASAGGR